MKRKNVIIDKKFQFRTTFSIIGIVYFIVSVIIAVIGINASINNRKLANVIKKHKSIISTQYDAFSTLLVIDRNKTWQELKSATEKAKADLERNHLVINSNIEIIKSINSNNNIILFSIIIFIILQGILLYYILIRMTHRMSGPIFLMSRYIDDIIKGEYPIVRALREKDEFKEFYEKFTEMVEILKKRDKV